MGLIVFVGDRIPFRIALEDYTASALGIFGATPLGHGLVAMAGNYFYVGWDCSSAFVGLLYVTVFGLSPLALRVKLTASLVGFPFIFLANLLRVAFIILSYALVGPATFFWTHLIIGPLLMSGLVVLLWYLFASRG
jgi:exosortase/archaeosortase family protein